jgi:hypothetical protein
MSSSSGLEIEGAIVVNSHISSSFRAMCDDHMTLAASIHSFC